MSYNLLDNFIFDHVDPSLEETHVPIYYDPEYSQPFFVAEITLADQPSYSVKFFINHLDVVPDNYFIYDYYGSGEIYINYNSFDKISCVNIKFFTQTYISIISNTNPSPFPDPFPLHISAPFVAAEYKHPLSQNSCYYMNTPIFFNLDSSDNSSTQVTLPTHSSPVKLCRHLTLNSNISEDYQFANVIDNLPICSTLSSEKNCVTCKFTTRFSSCFFYSPSQTLISKVDINHSNTSSSTTISLSEVKTISDERLFVINNDTEDVLINEFVVPSTEDSLSEEDVQNHVSDVFMQILSAYKNDNVVDSPKESIVESNSKSYILSLI